MAAKSVVIIGATGAVGYPLTRSLVEQGHDVTAVSRGRTEENGDRLDRLARDGAEVVFHHDLTDAPALVKTLRGSDVVVSAMRASPRTVAEVEPVLLGAARTAGVGRLVPSEFGTHTMAVEYGVSGQFDAKKEFQEALFDSGLDWTIVYGGGIAEYFMPHLRNGRTVTVYGERSMPWPTHRLDDIGAVSALAVTDDRTAGRAVQIHRHLVTHDQTVDALRRAWPDHGILVEHVSSADLERMLDEAETDPGDQRLSEREIAGITYANFVLGQLGVVDHPATIDADALYGDFAYRDPLDLLSDPAFVFGTPEPPAP